MKNMSPKKKILHLITGLGTGGTETALLRTLPKLQGHADNEVCCLIGNGPMGKALEKSGIPVHYLKLKHAFDIGCVFRFKDIVRKIEPDLMITYLIHADLFGRIFGKILGIRKIVSSQRGSLLQWEFLRFFDRATKSLVDRYTVQTASAKQELIKKLALPSDKFEVIPNAIDISEFDFDIDKTEKKSELEINPNNINIVCVSNLRRGKGHSYLLAAFENAFREHKQINLLIVGDGEEGNRLEKQVQNYSSKNNIHFLGKRSDVKEILKISDVFILPTLGEGMSNAIMEAMASGLAVITTNIQPNRELIDDKINGILVPIRDTNALTIEIKSLLRNQDKRRQLGNKARQKIVESFSIDSVEKKWVALLKKELPAVVFLLILI